MGRVASAILDDGTVVCAWFSQGEEESYLAARSLGPAGKLSKTHRVASVARSRSSGVPALASLGKTALVAWRDSAAPGRVLTAILALPE
ncbi:MAG: hypothetical protein V3W41_21195 [Planctomycetota bacterium]